MKAEYIEKIYAGWLGKIIGIRLGAPIEGWTHEKIRNHYGILTGYPVDYKQFAADDDSNGPLFFLRALEDKAEGQELTAQDVADALLNYAPFEHGFFWWGGYGISTEHTAYLNLRNGIPAPQSGSILQNGAAIAEQIGGQIFIDTWGLVAPGNPDLAAKLAREAASVTHDGNGIYGGIFIAVCISHAFEEQNMKKLIRKGLSYLPDDCEYARMVNAVVDYHKEHKNSWHSCFHFIKEHFGYDRYPRNCHIIPNSAVIILALLYGEGDFTATLLICNMCGWDTDCNVGNVAAIMGVRNGLQDIDYDKWQKPVNDFLACSSVIGSLNIMDLPYGALYIARLAAKLEGSTLPEPWNRLAASRIDSCHFEFPGSTHAIRVRIGAPQDKSGGAAANPGKIQEVHLANCEETAYSGSRSLKFCAKPVAPGEAVYVYRKTYYTPEDFHDSRYDPSFSPLLYPGQTIHGSAYLPDYGIPMQVSLYVRDAHTGTILESDREILSAGKWKALDFTIPSMRGALLNEMGFCFHVEGEPSSTDVVAMIDDLYADGHPDYSIEFDREREEVWNGLHREISQFTRLKGLLYLEEGQLHLSGCDFAEAYTGRHDWTNYTASFTMTPLTGEHHVVNVRVQGALRSYGVGLYPGSRAVILKNQKGYTALAETDFVWEAGKEYCIRVSVSGNRIDVSIDDRISFGAADTDSPYLTGSIGISMGRGCHAKYRRIDISS